ncbi:MAG: hypothetical protein RLN88_08790 [Ekhidna sp.]|uniref:hypothetical protein n=1 Tax=Ekhidna sp. TaxID=2608089 RepID=UPI0032F08DC5
MKKLLWLVLLFSGMAAAQEMDTVAVDTVEKEPPPYYLGVYVTGSISLEPSSPDQNIITSFGLGVQYQKWMLSFSIHDFRGSYKTYVIFPSVFELDYRYSGPEVAFQAFESEWVGAMLSAAYLRGDMVWKNMNTEENFLRDEFDLLKGAVKVELRRFRYAKPHLAIGYQKVRNLNLDRIGTNDFSGLFVAAGIRIGYFNQ